MDRRPYFELSFRPSFELVSTVRRFVEDFYLRVLGDHDMTTRVAIATHELLENAVKYSVDGETRIRVEVAPGEGPRTVSVVTRNRATEDHTSVLRSYLEEMNASTDAPAYYQQRMRLAAMRSESSQLGLARIRVEADMNVSCAVEGDCVTIKAETSGGEAHVA